jgi:hypothetical protein
MRLASSLLLVPLALAALVGTGCGSRNIFDRLPAWVSDPTEGGTHALAATGSSRETMGGVGRQTTFAENDARVKMAQTIDANVRALVEDFYSQGGEPKANERADEVRSAVSKTVTNAVVSGAVVKHKYQDEETKEIFVHIVLDGEAAKKAAAQLANSTRAAAEKAQVKAELKSEAAMDRLEKAIEKRLTEGK